MKMKELLTELFKVPGINLETNLVIWEWDGDGYKENEISISLQGINSMGSLPILVNPNIPSVKR